MSAACKKLLLIALAYTATVHAEPAALDADDAQAQHSGDLLQLGIPLVGLGLTYLLDRRSDANEWSANYADDLTAPGINWPGPRLGSSTRRDFLISFTRMELTTYALKYAINAKRPDGSGQSFPSGHTASAFMGAEFIRKNYGLKWGLPAYAAAAWVGYSRVDSKHHYWRDVLGGAVIGIASNYDFGNVDTPVGPLSFGPRLMMSNGSCDPNEPRGCLKGKPVMLPGLGFELRFR